jgi:hypothetical protein
MFRQARKPQPEAGSAMKIGEDNARLQAQFASREAEWVDAVSYWCDYLTIIDLEGQSDPGSRRAS